MEDHIKIRGITPRIQYVANGENTVFEFPFAIFKSDNLQVYINETLQNSNTYTVTGVGETNGGSVTFASAPTSGAVITLFRNLSIERTTDFQEGGALRANALNYELDYQTACQQQIAENMNRSMRLPPYAINTDVDLTLPMPESGKAIVWNADATNLENSRLAVNDMIDTLEGYKNTAEAKATIATEKASIATQKAEVATNKAADAAQAASDAAASAANRANLSLSNVDSNIDYVVESYKNGNDWYRIWKSGWLEQGGFCDSGLGTIATFNFLKPFADTSYTLVVGLITEFNGNVPGYFLSVNYGETATSFQMTVDGNTRKKWMACGIKAASV